MEDYLIMSPYKCDNWETAVNATRAKCDVLLVDNIITEGDGFKVQVFGCPSYEEKI